MLFIFNQKRLNLNRHFSNALICIRYPFLLQGELSTRLAMLARGKPHG